METHDVTVSLPQGLLQRVNVIAAQRQMSISALCARVLEDLVAQETHVSRARHHHLAWLRAPADLGTGGESHAARDELHER